MDTETKEALNKLISMLKDKEQGIFTLLVEQIIKDSERRAEDVDWEIEVNWDD